MTVVDAALIAGPLLAAAVVGAVFDEMRARRDLAALRRHRARRAAMRRLAEGEVVAM